MADYKHRGEKPDGFSFWTNELFGHQINGVYGPSLTVSSPHTAFDAPIDFIHVGDSGDENPLGLSAKDLFLDFMLHPRVHDTAMELIRTKLPEHIRNIALLQISNFIARERYSPRSSRPDTTLSAIDVLRTIAKSSALKS